MYFFINVKPDFCGHRNYVVQYVIDLKIPNANLSLAQQCEGTYIHLSMQKFSSNVVEKCLKVFKEANKANIILELLAMPQLELLLQHPYANYVIYSALQNSKVKTWRKGDSYTTFAATNLPIF